MLSAGFAVHPAVFYCFIPWWGSWGHGGHPSCLIHSYSIVVFIFSVTSSVFCCFLLRLRQFSVSPPGFLQDGSFIPGMPIPHSPLRVCSSLYNADGVCSISVFKSWWKHPLPCAFERTHSKIPKRADVPRLPAFCSPEASGSKWERTPMDFLCHEACDKGHPVRHLSWLESRFWNLYLPPLPLPQPPRPLPFRASFPPLQPCQKEWGCNWAWGHRWGLFIVPTERCEVSWDF